MTEILELRTDEWMLNAFKTIQQVSAKNEKLITWHDFWNESQFVALHEALLAQQDHCGLQADTTSSTKTFRPTKYQVKSQVWSL